MSRYSLGIGVLAALVGWPWWGICAAMGAAIIVEHGTK